MQQLETSLRIAVSLIYWTNDKAFKYINIKPRIKKSQDSPLTTANCKSETSHCLQWTYCTDWLNTELLDSSLVWFLLSYNESVCHFKKRISMQTLSCKRTRVAFQSEGKEVCSREQCKLLETSCAAVRADGNLPSIDTSKKKKKWHFTKHLV